jgi:predicted small metal-binding protein
MIKKERKEKKMARTIRCNEAQRTLDFDVDRSCNFVARAEDEDEALAEITDHLQTVHNWNEIFEPDLEKVRTQNVRNEV